MPLVQDLNQQVATESWTQGGTQFLVDQQTYTYGPVGQKTRAVRVCSPYDGFQAKVGDATVTADADSPYYPKNKPAYIGIYPGQYIAFSQTTPGYLISLEELC